MRYGLAMLMFPDIKQRLRQQNKSKGFWDIKKKFNDVNEIENNSVLTVKPLEIIAVSNRTSRTFRASESSGLFLQATCICKLKFIRMEHPRGTWSKITELSQ